MLRRCTLRLFAGFSAEGAAHPDMVWGNTSGSYRGPGWVGYHKVLPQEALMMQGGNSATDVADRVGQILDPEDPRHPIATFCVGGNTMHDGSTSRIVDGNAYDPVTQGHRLLQVLYDTYLEPFSMHRNGTILADGEQNPLANGSLFASAKYIGGLASVVGNVSVAAATTIGDGTTLKGDVNDIYINEGCNILDNCCLVCDKTTNLLAYQRGEDLNPYQTVNLMTGVLVIEQHTIVESNCFLDSCYIGSFARLGHGTHMMKGSRMGSHSQTLPGSVVIANTMIGDAELWGGAPARKLGKVCKVQHKRQQYSSNLVHDMVTRGHHDLTEDGDQNLTRLVKDQKLDTLMITFESHVTPTLRSKIATFVEGREPWHHKITRITQGWQPTNRGDDRNFMLSPPMTLINNFAEHNVDAKGGNLEGSKLVPGNLYSDYLW